MNSSGAIFATTHWSVVVAAGQSSATQASTALEELCRTHWYPLYAYVRHRGHGHDDAQDLTVPVLKLQLRLSCQPLLKGSPILHVHLARR